MTTRDRLTTLVRPMRVWRLLAMLAVVCAAITLDGGESHAQPAVTAVATDTEITLSWEMSGNVVFYWHKASETKVNIETVRSGKSHTISGLTPETRYRFFFYQGITGEIFATTLATNTDPEPPPAEEQEQPAEDLTPSQDYSEIVAGCVSDDLLETVRGYYDANKNRSPGYGANWKRVLIAFGDVQDSQLTAMTAADARTRESRWFGWQPVRKALDCIEANTAAPPQEPKQPAVSSEISIAAGPDVVEGDILTFTVTATPAPTAPLDVKVTVTATGSFAVPATTYTATISTSGSWLMKLSSYADSIDEPDGTVTATIDPKSGYTVSATASTATLAVQDDDDPPLPQVGITSGHMSIIEGDDVTLTITSTPAPATELTVPLSIVATGDFGVTSATQTVTIPTTGSVTHTISTFDDFTDEADGALSITVGGGTGYDVSLNGSFRYIQIADDDLTFAAQQARAQRAQSAMPQQTQTPTVTITPSTSTVSEGTAVALTITTTGTIPADGLPVTLKVGTNIYGQHRADLTSTSAGTTVSNINRPAEVSSRWWFIWKRVLVTSPTTTLTYTPTHTPYHDTDTTLTFQLFSTDQYMLGSSKKATIHVSDLGMTSASYKTCFPNGGPVSSSWVNTFTQYDAPLDQVGPLLGKRVLVALGETVTDPPPPMTVYEATEIRDRFTKTFRKAGYVYGRDIQYDWWHSVVRTLTMLEECARTGKGGSTPMKPVVSIISSQHTIEGSSNQFRITAVPAPASGQSITVNLSVREGSVTLGTTPTTVTITDTGVATLDLNFTSLTGSRTRGFATVTLTNDTGGAPTYMVNSDYKSATINVTGNSTKATAELHKVPTVTIEPRISIGCTVYLGFRIDRTPGKGLLVRTAGPFQGDLESVLHRGTKGSLLSATGIGYLVTSIKTTKNPFNLFLLGGYGYTFTPDEGKNTKTYEITVDNFRCNQ